MTAQTTQFADPLRVQPVTVPVRSLGRLTEILLTVDRPWTSEERAFVDAAEAEAAGSDPFYGMMES